MLEDARKALPNYFAIIEKEREANYLRCKIHPAKFDPNSSLDALWSEHERALSEFRKSPNKKTEAEKSLLDLKAEIASRILESCTLCERRCGVNRKMGEKGYCKVLESKVASEFIHWGEEPELVPSYTIFFSRCTFSCVFCQNWDISQSRDAGLEIEPRILARMIERERGKNTNWVGGDPTSNLPYILQVLKICNANIAQVWNSNMYLSKESMRLLDGVIDVYLTDFKYGNDECALRLSKVKDYWEVTTRNHLEARRQCELIIRHLVLPSHVECCSKPILNWIADNMDNVRVNVMAQYHPEWKAFEYEDINRRLTRSEFLSAYKYAEDLGLNLVERLF